MASTVWYGCLVATLVYGRPDPGEIAGVRLAGVIAVPGMLVQICLAAADQIRPAFFPIPALATKLIHNPSQLTPSAAKASVAGMGSCDRIVSPAQPRAWPLLTLQEQ